MKTKIALFLAILGCLLWLFACDEVPVPPESAQTLAISDQPANGSNVRLLQITSKQFYFDKKQKEILPKIQGAVNSGKYNIISVKTQYSSGYLTAAEITHDVSGPGDGNNLRVLFIQSDKYYWDQKAKEIQPKLDAIVNSGQYDIVKIQTTYARGYLLAAEVYYRGKK